MKFEVKKYQPLWGQLNKETKEHSIRVAELCGDLAEKLGLDEKLAYKIGYLHDIGKIYLPSRILKKNCKLTTVEREIVDLHSYIGYMLLRDMEEPSLVRLSVLYHHGFNKARLSDISEKPSDKLALLYYSVIYTADIYDARRHKRVYHDATADDIILAELEEDWFCNPRALAALRNRTAACSCESCI